MRRLLIGLILGLVAVTAAPSAASHRPDLGHALQVFEPVPAPVDWSRPQKANEAYVWTPLACDGSDALSGIGSVRIVGTATWTGTRAKTNETFRVLYQDGQDSWYVDAEPVLLPNEGTQVVDSVQDLRIAGSHLVKFKGEECAFTVSDLPTTADGFISHRTSYADAVENLRIEIRRYSTDEVIPCGSEAANAGRIKLSLFATNDVDAVLDFHVHHEREDATGPAQSDNPGTKRWWELAFDRVDVQAGVETRLTGATAVATHSGGNTFHLAQQNGPGQPTVEVFCSFTRT